VAWRMRVKMYESCSCKMVCRCTLGPAEPDQGWCSAAIGMEVLAGESDGVDLSGARVVLGGELPGDFLGGIDKAKLYLDERLSDDQRRELEAILHGEKGGLWAGLRQMIGTWLPSTVTSVYIADGEAPTVTVAGAGKIVLQPLTTEDGRRATLNNAPIAVGFGQDVLELSMATGSGFSDPDLRAWESLGYGSTSVVEWSG
jgi:hypothetical protein